MNKVAIERIHEPDREASSLFDEMEQVAQAVRRRAFDHFLRRGGSHGRDLDDWLRAERELVWSPGADMTENDKEVALSIQAPGFESRHIKVTATLDSILIQAEMAHHHDESNGTVRFCDFSRKLFRRFDLPGRIDLDKVTATVDKGILHIVAGKAQAVSKGRTIPVTTHNAAA